MSSTVFMVLMGGALVVQFAVLAAVGAAYLARRDGASYPTAAVRAAAAFGAALALAAAVTAAAATMMHR
ncbi:hypothetical protein AB0K02_27280 [Streptomyces sp. NPDC049597]|uniref:hypothetical protein n=1 Tax=Streptomyces sp. NPDC049597 TaxID=3155276 RepID=UPI003413E4A7